jgi:hypothetical protein
MSCPANPIATYRHSGQAVVTLRLSDGSGKDVLLGPFGSDASKAEYERVLVAWRATGRRPTTPTQLTVNELPVLYWRHATAYYLLPDGTPPANSTISAVPSSGSASCTATRRPASSGRSRSK